MKKLIFLLMLCAATVARAAEPTAKTIFAHEFAPAQGIIAAPEMPQRSEISLNGRWQFQPVPIPQNFKFDTGNAPELTLPQADKWDATAIKIPSPWNVNTWGNGRDAGAGSSRPYHADSVYFPSYPASWDSVQMGWLRRSFVVPATWKNRRLILHFEGVAGQAQIWLNGQKVGEHFDSFLPFDFDVTAAAKTGANELLVGVRKSTLFDVLSADYPANQRRTYPNGSFMDNLCGIWQDVSLLAVPNVRVTDNFIKPLVDQNALECEITLRNDSDTAQTVSVGGTVKSWVNLVGKDVISAPESKWRLGDTAFALTAKNVMISARSTAKITLRQNVNKRLKFWTPDAPNLYGLTLQIRRNNQVLDSQYTRFGWRQFKIRGRDLLLNSKKIQLVGDFLHPFGPFIGSRRYAWAYFRMIKDVGGNAYRPHAQPRPRHYLDLADEMGLCVLHESAIFGSSISLNFKAPQTWPRLQKHVDDLVLRDRNHPSVFGWSTANEMFAQFFNVNAEDRKIQFAQLQELALRPRTLDPTRPWISVDGDEDLQGVLPTWSKHFAIGVPTLPNINKPLMIGEHGGTYYAPPTLLEPLVGERAYENWRGRDEGLAIDLYRTIVETQPKLAFFSPSELAWYGLDFLPFGYRDHTRVPNLSDGIFFGPFVEGKPGIQIERLPPYVMSFNPGFDPTLPLYKPLPMFSAMRDALKTPPANAAKWAIKTPVQRTQPAATNTIVQVGFIGDDALRQRLYAMGIPLAEDNANVQLLVIDGDNLGGGDAMQVLARANEVLARGGMVWILARETGAALPQLQPLLGDKVALTSRRASSLLRGADDAAINGFGLGDLYFAEEPTDVYLQKHGIGGPLVDTSRVLLQASNTDWTLSNRRGESEKSAITIYEQLQKPSGATLIGTPRAQGKLWLSTLDTSLKTPRYRSFWRQLFQNLGVQLVAPPTTALVPSAREGDGAEWRYTIQAPAENWFAPDFADAQWQTGRAGFGDQVPNGQPHTAWHTPDIWLRHEFDVKAIPAALSLEVHHDEDVEVYLNGVRIFAEAGFSVDYKSVPLNADVLKNLRVGRNVLAVHCHQTAGGQYIDVGLEKESSMSRTSEHNLLLDGPLQ